MRASYPPHRDATPGGNAHTNLGPRYLLSSRLLPRGAFWRMRTPQRKIAIQLKLCQNSCAMVMIARERSSWERVEATSKEESLRREWKPHHKTAQTRPNNCVERAVEWAAACAYISSSALMAPFDLDACIQQLLRKQLLHEALLREICEKTKEVLMRESNVVHVSAPVTVVGDIHG